MGRGLIGAIACAAIASALTGAASARIPVSDLALSNLGQYTRTQTGRPHIRILSLGDRRLAIEKFAGDAKLKPRIARTTLMYELARAGRFTAWTASSQRARSDGEDVLVEEYIPFAETRVQPQPALPAAVESCIGRRKIAERGLISATDDAALVDSLSCPGVAAGAVDDLRRLALISYLTFQRDFTASNVLLHYDPGFQPNPMRAIAIDFESQMHEDSGRRGGDEPYFRLPFYLDPPQFGLEKTHFTDADRRLVESWRYEDFVPVLRDYDVPANDRERFRIRLRELRVVVRAEFSDYPVAELMTVLWGQNPLVKSDLPRFRQQVERVAGWEDVVAALEVRGED